MIELNTIQTAALMHCSVATLRYWRARNHGPAFHPLGHRIRYNERDVQNWIKEHGYPRRGNNLSVSIDPNRLKVIRRMADNNNISLSRMVEIMVEAYDE